MAAEVSNRSVREFTYRVLGGLHVRRDGAAVNLGGSKQKAVLAALLVEAGKPISADGLIDRVWGEQPPERAPASLQAYISNLRKLLSPPEDRHGVIVTGPAGYHITVATDDFDLTAFEAARRDGLAALAAGDRARALAQLDAALDLYGPPLPGLVGLVWVDELARRLDSLHAEATEGRFEALLALGPTSGLVTELEAAVASHPFRERLRGQLALALYHNGRQTEALRSLADTRKLLAEEVGVEPGPELQDIEARILDHDIPLAPRAASPVSPAPPATPAKAATSAAAGPAQGTGARSRDRSRGGTNKVAMIGRDAELNVLADAADAAFAGAGGTVVVSGQPGIGKTRMAEELADHVARTYTNGYGATPLVAWTRCASATALAPGWACRHMLDQVAASGALDAGAVEAVLAESAVAAGSTDVFDPNVDRVRLYQAAAAAFRSTTRPLLLVYDDLQWADASSLRLWEYMAGELRFAPIMLLATTRPPGPGSSPDMVACLSELARHSIARRLDLRGLTAAQVAEWMSHPAARGGAQVDPAVVDLVHRRTDGNPFFIGEVVELLAERAALTDADTARELGVPAAVQDVVRHRVDLLPEMTRKALAVASVVGSVVDIDLLAYVSAASVPATLEVLDPAMNAGLLVADATTPGQLRFAHALVAEAMAAELSLSSRANLHATIVDALEDLRPSEMEGNLAKLAHHASEGILAGTGDRAIDYAQRAARAATDRLAYDDSAAYWQQALGLVETVRPGDIRARYTILVELGDAHARVDNLPECHAALRDAIQLAEALGDPVAAQEAASRLPLGGLWAPTRYGETDTQLVAALQRVLADLGPEPTTTRADVLTALAGMVYYHDVAQADVWSAEAVEITRSLASPVALARALNRRYLVLLQPGQESEKLAIVDELVSLAETHTLPDALTCAAYFSRATTSLEQGDLATFHIDLGRARTFAERAASPALSAQVGWVEVAWLMFRGHYTEARKLALSTHDFYRRSCRHDWPDALGAHLALIGHDQGIDVDGEVETVVAEEVGGIEQAEAMLSGQYGLAIQEMKVWMLTELGRLDEARAAAGPPGTVPDWPADWLWPAVQAIAAHSRAALNDMRACRILYDRLTPHAGMVMGASPGGPVFGPCDLVLGRLAAALGDDRAGLAHIDAALGWLEQVGGSPWLARALLAQHELLARSEHPDDQDRAAVVLERCRALATDLGLHPVLQRLDALDAESQASAQAASKPGAG